jgi:hypothetical protein
MDLSTILGSLHSLTEDELRTINSTLITELKHRRSRDAATKRRLFSKGDKVSWTGRNGYTEGVIVRVKRKKAIVDVIGTGPVGFGASWDVPLNMLSAV